MEKPSLTVDDIRSRGFEEVGCWELNDARDLIHRIELPSKSGVYAFAVNGLVHYVGLASKSLRQRLGFYRKPGVSQRTNVRLNEIIRGHLERGTLVQIFNAHPPDSAWHGFSIKGAEGLEAGIIASYDLPWNMRGASRTVRAPVEVRASKSRTSNLADEILELVRKQPGLTELEIAKAIFGPSAVQQRVNQDCRLLVQRALVSRRGAGGRANPFTYFPAN